MLSQSVGRIRLISQVGFDLALCLVLSAGGDALTVGPKMMPSQSVGVSRMETIVWTTFSLRRPGSLSFGDGALMSVQSECVRPLI